MTARDLSLLGLALAAEHPRLAREVRRPCGWLTPADIANVVDRLAASTSRVDWLMVCAPVHGTADAERALFGGQFSEGWPIR